MAPVNSAIGDPAKMTKLVLEASGAGAEKIASGADQTNVKDGAVHVLTLGAGQGTAVVATDAERAEYLQESVDLPIKNEKVIALAKQAVGDAKTDAEKVAKLVAFVSEYIEDSFSAEPLTVLDIIRVKKGDCTEHASLFATLARAAGIPAREIGGLIYMGDAFKAFGGHAWNEVILDGKWVGIDATWNETKLNPTHIRLHSAERDSGAFMSVLGQVKFKLRSVEPPVKK
jgi:transglutaminase-like putative cysteine protease